MINVKLVQGISDLNDVIERLRFFNSAPDVPEGESLEEVIEDLKRIKTKLEDAYEFGEKERNSYRKDETDNENPCGNPHNNAEPSCPECDLSNKEPDKETINMVDYAANLMGMESGLHDESGHTDEI